MCNCITRSEAIRQFEAAESWIDDPWTTVSIRDGIGQFEEWVAQRPSSQESWDCITDWISRQHASVAEVASPQSPPPHSLVTPMPLSPAFSVIESVGDPPNKKARVFNAFSATNRPRDQPGRSSSSHQEWGTAEPPSIGESKSAEMERWQHNQGSFDPLFWSEVLTDCYHLDKESQHEIWLLAQHSEGGAEDANIIVSKLVHKRIVGDVLDNPSAFVHTACRHAYKRLGTWRPQHEHL